MEIVRLPEGEKAPPESDCIGLHRLPDGQVRLEASALAIREDEDGDESIALVDGGTYPLLGEAEAAGAAWAGDQGVERLYVSTDA